MTTRLVVVALLLLGAVAIAQTLEFDIPLPDSFAGVGRPAAAIYDPRQGLVYIAGDIGGVVVVDGASGQRVARIATPLYGTPVVCGGSNNHVYIGSQPVLVVDGATSAVLDTIALTAASSYSAYNPVSNKLYYVPGGSHLVVVDCSADSILRTINWSPGLRNIAVSTGSNKVYFALPNSWVVVMDGATDTLSRTIVVDAAGNMCYNPRMNRLYVCGTRHLSVIDCNTDSVIDSISLAHSFDMLWAARYNKLYCASGTNAVAVVDCSTNTITRNVSMPSAPYYFTYDTLRNEVYVTCQSPSRVAVIDGSTDSVVATVSGLDTAAHGPGCWDSRSGRMYIPSSLSYLTDVIDCATHGVAATLCTGINLGQAVYAGGEGKLYCQESDSGRLAVIDPATRRVLRHVTTSTSMRRLAYSRRWRRLYCSGTVGFAMVSTVNDSVICSHPEWRSSNVCEDPTGDRVYVASNSRIYGLKAATGDVLDSVSLYNAGQMSLDPLLKRLWCRSPSAMTVFDCSDRLRVVGSVTDVGDPTYDPWDGCTYGYTQDYIYVYDPISLTRRTRWPTPGATYPHPLRFNVAADRFYFYPNNGHDAQPVQSIDCRTGSIISSALVPYPVGVSFVAAGRRVWAASAEGFAPTVYDELLRTVTSCTAVGVFDGSPACDDVLGRTYVSDAYRSRIAALRANLPDSQDVACTFAASLATKPDTGDAVELRVVCVNCGGLEKTLPVRLHVFGQAGRDLQRSYDYWDSTMVTLDGCGYAVVMDTWRPTERGSYVVEFTSEWPGDVCPANDTARFTLVAGLLDVCPLHILAPRGSIDSGTVVVPRVSVLNAGCEAVDLTVRLTIGLSYADEQPMTVPVGDTQTVSFSPWTATEVGFQTARCSTMLAGDMSPGNDLLTQRFLVRSPEGIMAQDSVPDAFTVADWTPSPVRTNAGLRYGLPTVSEVNITIYSADGRCVVRLAGGVQAAGFHRVTWDARDDAGRLCRLGIYYCRVRAGTLLRTQKLTLVR